MTATVRCQVGQTWRDPEFWGPRGRGCAHCHEELPVAKDAGFGGALCMDCLMRWFPGCSFDWMVSWLGKQQATLIRQQKREQALAAAERGDLTAAMTYEKEYGVWLVTWRSSP